MSIVEDLNNLTVMVGHMHHPFVWDAAIEGISHGLLVGVLLALDAAVAMVATVVILCQVVMDCILAATDEHVHPEFHPIIITLGQQKPLRMATTSRSSEVKLTT